jgi:hypothetical protein
MHTKFWSENLNGRGHSEDLGNNNRMDLQEIGWESVDCMHLAQDMDNWWALVNTEMNLQVP